MSRSITIQLLDSILAQETSKKNTAYVSIHCRAFPGAFEQRLFFARSTLGELSQKAAVAKPFPAGSVLEASCSYNQEFKLQVESIKVVEAGPGEAKVYVLEKRAENAKADEVKGTGSYGAPADLS